MRPGEAVRIEDFDVTTASDQQLADYVTYVNRRRVEDQPEDPLIPSETVIAELRNLPGHIRAFGWLARGVDGGVVAETHGVFQDTPENRQLLQVELGVLESFRRRGLGSELLARVLDRAESLGRSNIIGVTSDRVPAGAAFCEALGASPALEQHINRLTLAQVDRRLVSSWVEEGPGRAAGYSLVGFDGACPEDLVEDLADLLGVMNDAPRGELAIEDHHLTVEELRASERMALAAGYQRWWLLARHDTTGALVGLTDVSWDPRSPEIIHQGNTGVRTEHRGRGLGKWLKATMLQRILDELPAAIDVRTGNADSNAAMLAINNRLGFRPHIAWTNWQANLAELRKRLASLSSGRTSPQGAGGTSAVQAAARVQATAR